MGMVMMQRAMERRAPTTQVDTPQNVNVVATYDVALKHGRLTPNSDQMLQLFEYRDQPCEPRFVIELDVNEDDGLAYGDLASGPSDRPARPAVLLLRVPNRTEHEWPASSSMAVHVIQDAARGQTEFLASINMPLTPRDSTALLRVQTTTLVTHQTQLTAVTLQDQDKTTGVASSKRSIQIESLVRNHSTHPAPVRIVIRKPRDNAVEIVRPPTVELVSDTTDAPQRASELKTNVTANFIEIVMDDVASKSAAQVRFNFSLVVPVLRTLSVNV